MIRICAWCKEVQGLKEPLDDNSITHGICLKCSDAMIAELGTNVGKDSQDVNTDSGRGELQAGEDSGTQTERDVRHNQALQGSGEGDHPFHLGAVSPYCCPQL